MRHKRTRKGQSNKQGEMSVCWRGVCLFGGFVCQLRMALIGSSPPVSGSASSSNYILFSPLLFFTLCSLAFLFLFWLGSAADYTPHKPITTPFRYARCHGSQSRDLAPIRMIFPSHSRYENSAKSPHHSAAEHQNFHHM